MNVKFCEIIHVSASRPGKSHEISVTFTGLANFIMNFMKRTVKPISGVAVAVVPSVWLSFNVFKYNVLDSM